MRAMFVETNPIPVKFAASRLRLCKNKLRSPMTSLHPEHEDFLIDRMKRLGLSVDE
jgi:4-hydroxy-tetrahydrodipicolinate synthase